MSSYDVFKEGGTHPREKTQNLLRGSTAFFRKISTDLGNISP